MKKVLYRVSALSRFDLNAQSPDTLPDSAASVHVFNSKDRFSNFKRAPAGQGLLYGSNVIPIEERGQISLPPEGERSHQATNTKSCGLHLKLSIEPSLPRMLAETRL